MSVDIYTVKGPLGQTFEVREETETSFAQAAQEHVGPGSRGGLPGGLKFDGEKPRMDLISPIAAVALARVLTFGAKKYADNNWRKGIAWTRIVGAILRHAFAYLMGETNDPETGISHMAHIMCEAMFLIEFEQTHPELDDRYKLGENK
jgi:hypothetical protein